MDKSSPITIIGGGIAGLAASLALAPREAVLLEQADQFSEVGAGLQLGPNAVRALQQLGAWDAVEPITSSPPAIHMHDGVTGERLQTMPLGVAFARRFGAPYRVAHRADLHTTLLALVRDRGHVDLRLNQKLTGFLPSPQGSTMELGGTRRDAATVIAADGVHSHVRQAMFPGSAAIHAGHHLHRALVPIPDSTSIAWDCVNVWMLPEAHVVHYPVGLQGLLNVVAVTPAGRAISLAFARAATPLANLLDMLPEDLTPWEAFYAPPLPRWHNATTCLIGDAAHATVPYLAQGAAMALEDAAELKRSLATAMTFGHAFAEVSSRRNARCLRLQTESLKAGKTYHQAGLTRLIRNAGLKLMPETLLWSRLSWIYRG